MSVKIQFLSPNLVLPQSTKFQSHHHHHPFSSPIRIAKASRILKISCSNGKENVSDEMLAAELGLQLKRLNYDVVLREEALKKSRELLFAEICDFMGLKSEELKKKWRRLDEEEKLSLVEGFVAGWSAHFHPLSLRSVKEMVEDYVGVQSLSNNFFSHFTRLFQHD